MGLFEDEGTRERTVYLRESAGWTFGNTVADCPPSCSGPPRYQWARIDVNPDRILVWAPRADRIEELVRAGRLPGSEPGSRANLGPLQPAHHALLTSAEAANFFEWDAPTVLVRATD